MSHPTANYKVIPLQQVRRDAKKILNPQQLQAAIKLCKLLKYYPQNVGLDFERCVDGFELRIDDPVINKQGWLRAAFWVHEKAKVIYIVDVFWKKTNQVSQADLHRINHRIRQLKLTLARKS